MQQKTIKENQQKHIEKMKQNQYSQHTIKKYNTAYNNFNKYLQNTNTKEIPPEKATQTLEQYKKNLINKKLSNNTINQYIILLTNFFKNQCHYPIQNIEQIKTTKREPKYITIQQYHTIINHYNQIIKTEPNQYKKDTAHIDKTITKIIFNTGLRIHEILNITIDDITNSSHDKNNNHQLRITGKGKKTRTIILQPEIYKTLQNHIQKHTTPTQIYLFENNYNHTKQHKPYTAYTIQRHFQKTANTIDKQEKIDPQNKNSYTQNYKPHNLRHSFAIIKLQQGMKINTLQKALGHDNITTTQIYTAINDDELSTEFTSIKVL